MSDQRVPKNDNIYYDNIINEGLRWLQTIDLKSIPQNVQHLLSNNKIKDALSDDDFTKFKPQKGYYQILDPNANVLAFNKSTNQMYFKIQRLSKRFFTLL